MLIQFLQFLWTISTLILRNQVKSKKNHCFQKNQMFSYSKQMHILLSKKWAGSAISIIRVYKNKSTCKMLNWSRTMFQVEIRFSSHMHPVSDPTLQLEMTVLCITQNSSDYPRLKASLYRLTLKRVVERVLQDRCLNWLLKRNTSKEDFRSKNGKSDWYDNGLNRFKTLKPEERVLCITTVDKEVTERIKLFVHRTKQILSMPNAVGDRLQSLKFIMSNPLP